MTKFRIDFQARSTSGRKSCQHPKTKSIIPIQEGRVPGHGRGHVQGRNHDRGADRSLHRAAGRGLIPRLDRRGTRDRVRGRDRDRVPDRDRVRVRDVRRAVPNHRRAQDRDRGRLAVRRTGPEVGALGRSRPRRTNPVETLRSKEVVFVFLRTLCKLMYFITNNELLIVAELLHVAVFLVFLLEKTACLINK